MIRQNIKLNDMDPEGAKGEKYFFADVNYSLNKAFLEKLLSLWIVVVDLGEFEVCGVLG